MERKPTSMITKNFQLVLPWRDELNTIIAALNLETGMQNRKVKYKASSLADGIIIHSQPAKSSRNVIPLYTFSPDQSKIGLDLIEIQQLESFRRKPRAACIQTQKNLNTSHKAAQHQWFYQLSRKLYIGRKLFSVKELNLLRNENVVAVLSVHEHIVPPDVIKSLGFCHFEINVREGDPLTFLQLVNGIKFIRSIVQMRAGSIYVHCRLGRVRCVMLCVVRAAVKRTRSSPEFEPLDPRDTSWSRKASKLRNKHREILAELERYNRIKFY
eukprot:767548-Hanusia_phi.AAC.10